MSVTEGNDKSLVSGTDKTQESTKTPEQLAAEKSATDAAAKEAADKAAADKATADEKAAADKKAAEEKAAAEALTPESIKVPDGLTVDEAARTEFLGIMNNRELTPQARAQALIDLQAKVVREASEKISQEWADQQKKWQDDAKADPEIGGEKLEANLAGITKLIDEYGSKEFREVMDLTGAGNNPHVIRMLHKIAKKLALEGEPTAIGTASGTKVAADVLYPNQGKNG